MVVGEALQIHELLALMLLVIGLVPLTLQYYRYRTKWFYGAYLSFALAGVFTNLEAFSAPALFNYLEHLSLLTASVLYWMTAQKSAEAVVDADVSDVVETLLPERVMPDE